MMQILARGLDLLRGDAGGQITVPPMDGPLRPNQRLEDAAALLTLEEPDNLLAMRGRVLCSSGADLLALDPATGATQKVANFAAPIACLAAAPDGGLALGLDDGSIRILGGRHDGQTLNTVEGRRTLCPTALAFSDPGTLLICLGSQHNPPRRWTYDLMERRASGSVWRVDLGSDSAVCLADDLAYPYGIAPMTDGRLAIAESWRHRVIALGPDRGREILLDDLPGYPARLSQASGGAWLCVFAPRSQLIEFVLSETAFRTRMMREIEPRHWIAPQLSPPHSFLEPLQGGALKQLGRLKPWAPSRSYGLLIRLDEKFQTLASAHSRADGTRHGITSCLDIAGRVLATAKGGDAVIALEDLRP